MGVLASERNHSGMLPPPTATASVRMHVQELPELAPNRHGTAIINVWDGSRFGRVFLAVMLAATCALNSAMSSG